MYTHFILGEPEIIYLLREGRENIQEGKPWLKAKAFQIPHQHGELQVLCYMTDCPWSSQMGIMVTCC